MIGRNFIYPLAFGLAAPLPAQESGEPSDEMIVNGEPPRARS